MKPRTGLLLIVTAAVGLIAASSCASPPTDQARKAHSALADLRDVEKAEKWAPDEYAAAAATLETADKELRAQTARFFITRDYAKTSELYARSIEDMAMARDAARAGKETADKHARQALEAALAAIEHAQAALTIAPVSRDSRSSLELLDGQLERAAQSLDQVRNLIVAEDYKQATERAEEILRQVTSMLHNVSRGSSR